MKIINGRRLNLTDVLLHVHVTPMPMRVSSYLPLLHERYAEMSFAAFEKAIREAYAMLAASSYMRRYRDKNKRGYQFEITAKGREKYNADKLIEFFNE